MGKQARIARQLQEQAQIATDLNMLKTRPFLMAGLEAEPVNMMTQLGNTPGVRVTFHMQNGTAHDPIILDPIAALTVIAAIASSIVPQGRPGPEPHGDPTPEDLVGVDKTAYQDDPTTTEPSGVSPGGIILP